MSTIGPLLPAHLLSRQTSNGLDEVEVPVGPQFPPGVLKKRLDEDEDEDEDDDYAPALPPDMITARSAGPSVPRPSNSTSSTSKRVVGPALPSYPPIYDPKVHSWLDEEDDDDDDFGPKPLPAGVKHAEKDAVAEFLEREERRRKLAQEAEKPKALQREEWMLVPPSSSDLLGGLDPTKLKARQFSRSTAPASNKQDNSLWTETPAERQQRLADEVSGKKRRAVDAIVEEEGDDKKRRKMQEEAILRGVDDYTRKIRGPALMEQHVSSGKAETPKDKDAAIWEHSRDMSLGGRLMDDTKRKQLVREARGLDDRFGKGKSGGFL